LNPSTLNDLLPHFKHGVREQGFLPKNAIPQLPSKFHPSQIEIMQKQINRLILMVCAAVSLTVYATAATVDLDLKSALDRAPQANFQILLSEEGLVAQEQTTRITRSALLPQVSLEAAQGRAMSPTVDAFTKSFPGVSKRYFNDRFDALLRARLSLLSTRTWDDWKLSKLTLQATRLQVEDTVQEILSRIAGAYFTHWRNQRRLDVIDVNLERDRLLLQIATDQRDAGVATDLDVTRAEVRLASNELARLQQETTLLNSSLSLKRILDLPLENDLRIQQQSMDLEIANLQFSPSRFTDILESRPDYRQLRTELERETLAVQASRRDRLPSLQLTGAWGYASESWSDDMEEQWSIGIGLSMPVFEGFRLDSEQRLAASAMRSKELELADLSAQIEADYRLALQSLESRFRQVEVARRSVSLNQREFELSRIRFEQGVADNSDVVTAQANLADAEDTLVEAEYQYAQARINLARVEGDVRTIVD
jgi:outer membrane protein TolC